MKKIMYVSKLGAIGAVLLLAVLLIFGTVAVPDEMTAVSDAVPQTHLLYTLQPVAAGSATVTAQGVRSYDVQVNLLGVLPVKTATMTVRRRQYVTVSGELFGLRLYTDGVVVAGTQAVLTADGEANPADDAGLAAGDVILRVNGETIRSHTQLAQMFASFDGTPMTVVFLRGGEQKETALSPAYCDAQKKYLAGLWIKDSAAGIGTLTFFEQESGVYAGLGHAVCDAETNEPLPLFEGDIVTATVSDCRKGSASAAGALSGKFADDRCGSLLVNGNDGVYGFLEQDVFTGSVYPVATRSEVQVGDAQIIATVDGAGPQAFDAKIERVDKTNAKGQNLTLRITDDALLRATGGIVQGMSGSPVVQNGMLVGAVTHVFLGDPKHGYAIFAQTMLEKAHLLTSLIEEPEMQNDAA